MRNHFWIFIIIITSGIGSCKKKISPDDPFPDERMEAIYITANNQKLFGLNPDNGEKVWEYSFPTNVFATPVIEGDRMYVATQAGSLYCFDLLKRDTAWVKHFFVNGAPHALIAGSGKIYIAASDSLSCIDMDGNLQWRYGSGPALTCAPQLANGYVYTGFGTDLVCLATDGTVVWKKTGLVATSIANLRVSGGNIYVTLNDGSMNAYKDDNGALVWKYMTGDLVVSSPAVYGGMVVFGSDDNKIYCVDEIAGPGNTGLLRWSITTSERVRTSATFHKETNTAIIGGSDSYLYGINHVNGTIRWKYPTNGLLYSSPVVVGNYIYFGSYDKYFYCIDVRNGTTVWKRYIDQVMDASPIADMITEVYYPGISGMSMY